MSGDGFDQRKDGFETKFEREQEDQFRKSARRDKAFARWAAARMGMEGEAVDTYEMDVIKASLEMPGDDDILQKVGQDLEAKGCGMPEAELRAELERAGASD